EDCRIVQTNRVQVAVQFVQDGLLLVIDCALQPTRGQQRQISLFELSHALPSGSGKTKGQLMILGLPQLPACVSRAGEVAKPPATGGDADRPVGIPAHGVAVPGQSMDEVERLLQRYVVPGSAQSL